MDFDLLGRTARHAARRLALLDRNAKDTILQAMAAALKSDADSILAANTRDVAAAEAKGTSAALVDRLRLTPARLDDMAKGLIEIAALPDPVGRSDSSWIRPNGLRIEKVTVPVGVIAIIFEARPNVGADAAALCLKSGNAVILRGGSEAKESNAAIASCLDRAGRAHGLPEGAIQFLPGGDRALVKEMLRLDKYIDLVIPRGGDALVHFVAENSTIPVIKNAGGVCHLFVEASADLAMAESILINGKCQRPSVCNALETLLIEKSVAAIAVPHLAAALRAAGVEIRGDAAWRSFDPAAKEASDADFAAEFLDLVISCSVVDDLGAAIEHINQYGSGHSEVIITNSSQAATRFRQEVDAACVYVNASTRFTDGGQFGMGAEIGISTGRLHARGPLGLQQLVTWKHLVSGNGQIR